MSRSSSSLSGLRGWRCGPGWDDGAVDGEFDGPVVGHECCVGEDWAGDGVDWAGEAGVCGTGGWLDGWWAVRTGSPACGRAEWVVPRF